MATAPATKPSAGATAALIALALFTIFITWRAKMLEASISSTDKTVELLHKPAPAGHARRPGWPARIHRGLPRQESSDSHILGKLVRAVPDGDASSRFYKKKPQANTDFEILAISLDDDREAAEIAATELKMPFPVLLDSAHAAADAYQVQAIPTLIVIDKDR